MYEQQTQNDIFFIMCYTGVMVISLMASVYLLFRRGNAFAPDVTPPKRLRQLTAALFAATALAHLWYMPVLFLTSKEDAALDYLIGGLLDSLIIFPLTMAVLLSLLQDRRRPLWPVAVITAPSVVLIVWYIVTRHDVLIPVAYTYFALLGIGLVVYMGRALRQYGRWLRDNYADLEHKEVSQSFVVIAFVLLVFGFYVFGTEDIIYSYVVQVCNVLLVCCLLWRVETLSDLSAPQPQSLAVAESVPTEVEDGEDEILSQATIDYIGTLLQEKCITPQLYLQHDLTISQLAKTLGTNRSYLSKYFSCLDMTYNAYINNLRVDHFVSLYREAVSNDSPVTARQLARNSGYKSYSTFSLAFKQRMGQNVTTWMQHWDE